MVVSLGLTTTMVAEAEFANAKPTINAPSHAVHFSDLFMIILSKKCAK
jgi:hypothetical protein